MKITSPNDICISVELTDDDMKKLDITYDELDYSNIETRRVLWTVLDEARRISGKSISLSDNLLIETKPSEKGGCIIFFISLPAAEKQRSEKTSVTNSRYLICDFAAADDMLDFIEKTKNIDILKKTALYKNNGKYRAAVYCSADTKDKFTAICEEYAKCKIDSAENILSATKEHWQCVTENMYNYFS